MTETENHLRLLSIFYYVLAGFQALMGCAPIIHVGLGAAMLTGNFMPAPPVQPGLSDSEAAMAQAQMESMTGGMQVMGGLFLGIGLLTMALSFGIALLFFFTGRSLANRRHYTFCLVASGLACIMIPFGTVLGVFSLIVLLKPHVRALFQGEEVSNYAPPPPAA
jgi:hypothetical protein